MANSVVDHYWSPIGPLLADPSITDIYITRHDCVAIRRRGRLIQTECVWESEQSFSGALLHLSRLAGIDVGTQGGMFDTMLNGTIRVNAGVPPLAKHAHATLRIPAVNHFTFDDLVANGMIATHLQQCLRRVIEAKQNYLISGTTGSGKTTLLRAMVSELSDELVTFVIEDTDELHLSLPFMLHHTAPVRTGGGGVDPSVNSIYAALRSAPDRVIVGEIRRPGQLTAYLRVLACGFQGASTIHAVAGEGVLNRAREMLMEVLSFADPGGYDVMFQNNVQILIHCADVPGIGRRVTSVDWVDPTRRALRNLYHYSGRILKSDVTGIEAFIKHTDKDC